MGLPAIGTHVRYIGTGRGFTEGVVVRHGKGYERHRCPNHQEAPDCICGDRDDGRVQAMPDWAVVDWEGPRGETCIDADEEGTYWEVM